MSDIAGLKTDLSLSEQLRISRQSIEARKNDVDFSTADLNALRLVKASMQEAAPKIVDAFYNKILKLPEVVRLIGDAESLTRLKSALRMYVVQLFNGDIGLDYVRTRLRIGQVHKRIGVTPKFFVPALWELSRQLKLSISQIPILEDIEVSQAQNAVEKLLFFDMGLIFDTYIYSLLDEIEAQKNELIDYSNVLEQEIAARTRELEEIARQDNLTGLLNQRSFYQELNRELARCSRLRTPLSLVFVDLDKFKALNDQQGHLKGDACLTAVGKMISMVIRESDLAFRYGGDEFAMVLPETDLEQAQVFCKRMIDSLVDVTVEFGVTFSVGIADTGDEGYLDAEALVKNADSAMYQAKAKEGSIIATFNE